MRTQADKDFFETKLQLREDGSPGKRCQLGLAVLQRFGENGMLI